MTTLPILFVSHGSPMLAIEDTPARRFLLELGKTMPSPKAIVVISAHWESVTAPTVSLAEHPETIYDFRGFPQALYEIKYPAPGAVDVAEQAATQLEQAGFAVKFSPLRGLDHGAWIPLHLMYPAADIPVTQIALIHNESPAKHYQMGQALAKLRDQGVLVIGSGSLTHNLYELGGNGPNAATPDWVLDFDSWIASRLLAGDRDALLDYRQQAPFATRNHPTEEHLLPLFVAMGAAGENAEVERIHTSHEYSVLAMDAYAFS